MHTSLQIHRILEFYDWCLFFCFLLFIYLFLRQDLSESGAHGLTRATGHSRCAVYKNSEYLLSRPSHFTVSELKKAHKGGLLDSLALSISSQFCISKHTLVAELAGHFSVFVALLYSVPPAEIKKTYLWIFLFPHKHTHIWAL